MKEILVTGCMGFIGSNLTKLLIKSGYKVIGIDALTYAGDPDNLKELKDNENFEFIKGDIANDDIIYDVDMIVHLAAETHVDRSIYDIQPFIHSDYIGTYMMLERLRQHPCEKFIYISTSEVYGSAQTPFIDETHPLDVQSPYAATKLGAERMTLAYYKTFKLPIIIIRPFNNYGNNQHPEKMIPLFITNAIENKPLYVYGDGSAERDWLYVKDCCEGIKKVLEGDLMKLKGQIINLGSGDSLSINTVAKMILEYLGKGLSLIKTFKDRPGHVERLTCNNSKAETLLGWKPTTLFSVGLKNTIDWYVDNELWWRKIKDSCEWKRYYTRYE